MAEDIDRVLAKGRAKASWLKFRAKRGLRELTSDERGLSGVVVAVLLILVAVLAVVLLWGQLKGWLSTTWSSITSKAGEIN